MHTTEVMTIFVIFMVAICNTADHYIFALWLLSIFFISSPNLSGPTAEIRRGNKKDR